jgi:hypothetical protein
LSHNYILTIHPVFHPLLNHLSPNTLVNIIKMRFSTASIIALAAGASATVIPRSPYGQWYVEVTVSPDHSNYVTAKFTSDSYPDGLRNACVDNPFSDPPVPKRCDHAETTYSYDGQSKFKSQQTAGTESMLTNLLVAFNISQTVDKPSKQTLFGSAYLPFTEDLHDGRIKGHAIVPVQKAIA